MVPVAKSSQISLSPSSPSLMQRPGSVRGSWDSPEPVCPGRQEREDDSEAHRDGLL
jgi:hypothetical protein